MFKQCQKTVTLVLISGGYNELVRPIKTQNISRVPAFQQHVEATGCPPIGSTRWHPCREKGGRSQVPPTFKVFAWILSETLQEGPRGGMPLALASSPFLQSGTHLPAHLS